MPENDLEQEAKSIFMNALDCATAADRRDYVRSACGSNKRLRAHVQALLQAHDAPAILTEPPAIDLAPGSPPTEGPGTVIGRYKLLELIGEGGFGAVYMAEQQEPVRRTVALKIVKLGMDTREVIARFEAERQALALMERTSPRCSTRERLRPAGPTSSWNWFGASRSRTTATAILCQRASG